MPKHLRARWAISERTLEVTSPALEWFLRGPWFRTLTGGAGFAAATIGHVIVARNEHCMRGCRVHERVHVGQCERWGILFPLAYVAAGLWAALRHRRWSGYYWDNVFEVEARHAESLCEPNAESRKDASNHQEANTSM